MFPCHISHDNFYCFLKISKQPNFLIQHWNSMIQALLKKSRSDLQNEEAIIRF